MYYHPREIHFKKGSVGSGGYSYIKRSKEVLQLQVLTNVAREISDFEVSSFYNYGLPSRHL